MSVLKNELWRASKTRIAKKSENSDNCFRKITTWSNFNIIKIRVLWYYLCKKRMILSTFKIFKIRVRFLEDMIYIMWNSCNNMYLALVTVMGVIFGPVTNSSSRRSRFNCKWYHMMSWYHLTSFMVMTWEKLGNVSSSKLNGGRLRIISQT